MIFESDQELLLQKLDVFRIHGRDKRGRKILCIVGKSFPGRRLTIDGMKRYLHDKIFSKLENRPFCIVYFHAGVRRSVNFPGISALKSIYGAIPVDVRDNLEAVYFVHPDLQSKLFLATFGRFLFSRGLYGKLQYVSRLGYLWEQVRRKEIEIPDFVEDHDDDLEYLPMIDYGQESDHPRVYGATIMDSSVPMFSMRSIS